jgi:uncharacterized protein with PIN domain
MKPPRVLSPQQIAGFLDLIGQTREHEFTCGECLEHVAEFAERQLAGRAPDDAMRSVEQHLFQCPECREEYEALRQLLLDPSTDRGGNPDAPEKNP